jgi:hypothetical protein
VGIRPAAPPGGPALCALTGAPIDTAILALSLGHVVSYALLFGLCVRAADAADSR